MTLPQILKDPDVRGRAESPTADNPREFTAATKRPSHYRLLILCALLVGAWLRLAQFVGGRSLWLDEALLSETVLTRTFVELLDPRLWGVTPPGFLLLSKAATVLLGSSEYGLRAVPLVAGLASLPLMLMVSRRYLSRGAVPWAVWLFALAPFLLYYASEFKQYSTDVAVALALLLYADHLRRGALTLQRAVLWGLVGVGAVFLSQTAVFVLGGATLAIFATRAGEKDWRSAAALAAPAAGWAVLFGVPYLLFLRGVDTEGYMQAFWQSGFMPLPPRSLHDLGWFPETFQRVFRDPLGAIGDRAIEGNFYQAAAGMAAFGAGVAWMWRSRREVLLILTLPVVLTLLASGLRAYPFGGEWLSSGRVILFLVPGFFLIIAEGVHRMTRYLPAFGIGIGTLLLAPSAAYAILAVPGSRVEVRTLVEHAAENWQPGDVLYIHYELNPAVRYYAPRILQAGQPYRQGTCSRFQPERYIDEVQATLSGAQRLWVLFGTGTGAQRFDEKGLILGYLDHVAEKTDGVISQGASIHLYQVSGEPVEPYQASIRPPHYDPKEDCRLWGTE